MFKMILNIFISIDKNRIISISRHKTVINCVRPKWTNRVIRRAARVSKCSFSDDEIVTLLSLLLPFALRTDLIT